MGLLFSMIELSIIKRKAMRRGLWFKVLDKVERAIINLTIRCVRRIRSLKLAGIVSTIMDKLTRVMRSRVGRLMEKVGHHLAKKLSWIAQSWGCASAVGWAQEPTFIQYLTVMYMNAPTMFKG